MRTDTALATVAQRLDEVGSSERSWRGPLQAIASLLDAKSGFVRVVSTSDHRVLMAETFGYDESYIERYKQHFVRLDPYRASFRSAAPGVLLMTDRLVDRRQHSRTEYFNDYERPQDLYHAAGGTVCRLPTATVEIGFQRGRRAGPFGNDHLSLLKSLFPRIQRTAVATGLGAARSIESMALAAIEQLAMGVLLFDETSRCRFANKEACQLAERFALKFEPTGVSLGDPDDAKRIRELIAEAHAGYRGELHGLGSAPGVSWTAVPIDGPERGRTVGSSRCGVALHISTHHCGPTDWIEIARFFGLTVAEARVARQLAEGLSAHEIARNASVSVHTVRAQLASCFEKTSTHRQAQLVALLRRMGV